MIFGRQKPEVVWKLTRSSSVRPDSETEIKESPGHVCDDQGKCGSGLQWLLLMEHSFDLPVAPSQIEVSLNKRLNARLLLGTSSWVFKCVYLVMAFGTSVDSELSLSRPESCRVHFTFLKMYWIWSTHPSSWWSIWRCSVGCHKFF